MDLAPALTGAKRPRWLAIQALSEEQGLPHRSVYLSNTRSIAVPTTRRPLTPAKLTIKGARANNLQNITVDVPLGVFVAVTESWGRANHPS